MDNEEASGALVTVQVMSSPTAGVMLNGTTGEPDAGNTVGETVAVFVHDTDGAYWLRAESEAAAMVSVNVYERPAVAVATVTTPVLAVTVEPEPVVVALPPEAGAPLGAIAMVNWSVFDSREPESALTRRSFVTEMQVIASGVATVSVVVTPTTSVVPVVVGRSFTVAGFVIVAGQVALDEMFCS